MVKSIINLSERESRIVNMVKAKYGLKDKSQALSLILRRYEECELEPQLRPEFVKEIQEARERGKFVKIKNFSEEFKTE
ncbi:MAG: DUF2683 family protein [Candidatus Bathyarchaeota archaeon]|nr:DUF2683 family protein [Candidatus Bathyarchaeota archaeon]